MRTWRHFKELLAISCSPLAGKLFNLANSEKPIANSLFYGWYLNKNRGISKNTGIVTAEVPDMADQNWQKLEPESAYIKKCRLKPVVSQVEPWAALIKAVYEACTERSRSACN